MSKEYLDKSGLSYFWGKIKSYVSSRIANMNKEAFLTWGGQNFTASYGPIDAAMVSDLGANRFAFLKGSAVTVEYSRDGGSTWTDYGLTDAQKGAIFATGHSTYIGKADANNKATAHGSDYQLRITVNAGVAPVYSTLNKFVIYVSTNGSTNCKVQIQKALESTPTTFVNHTDPIPIAGWSGYNVINTAGLTTYGNSPASQYGRVRFVFTNGNESASTTYNGLNVMQIMAFGGVGWITPSTMAKTGHLYGMDSAANATFPAQLTATQFNGPLNGTATAAGILKTSMVTGETIDSFRGDNLKHAKVTSYSGAGLSGNDGSVLWIPYNVNWGMQLLFDDDTYLIKKRTYGNGTWSAWKDVDTTYSDVVAGGSSGLMTGSDKTKLNGIATGAEVNQNAFSNVKVGSTTIAADGKTDTLELDSSFGIDLTPDATNDKVTIGINGSYIDAAFLLRSGAANGICPLDANAKIDSSYISNAIISNIGTVPLNGNTTTANIDTDPAAVIQEVWSELPNSEGDIKPFGGIIRANGGAVAIYGIRYGSSGQYGVVHYEHYNGNCGDVSVNNNVFTDHPTGKVKTFTFTRNTTNTTELVASRCTVDGHTYCVMARIKANASTSEKTIGTIPSAYAPPVTIFGAVTIMSGNNSVYPQYCYINSSGGVVLSSTNNLAVNVTVMFTYQK